MVLLLKELSWTPKPSMHGKLRKYCFWNVAVAFFKSINVPELVALVDALLWSVRDLCVWVGGWGEWGKCTRKLVLLQYSYSTTISPEVLCCQYSIFNIHTRPPYFFVVILFWGQFLVMTISSAPIFILKHHITKSFFLTIYFGGSKTVP